MAVALPTQAQVMKCTDAAGKVTYQDGPCTSERDEWISVPGTGKPKPKPEIKSATIVAPSKKYDFRQEHEERLRTDPQYKQMSDDFDAARKRREANDEIVMALRPGERLSGSAANLLEVVTTTETRNATHKHFSYCARYQGRVSLYAINDVIQSKSVYPGSCK